MKKIIAILLTMLMFASAAHATCYLGTPVFDDAGGFEIVVSCTGSGTDEQITIPISTIRGSGAREGFWITGVSAAPVAGATAPDAADVFLFKQVSSTIDLDLLGSTDGVTAVAGLNLLHATIPKSTLCMTTDGANYVPRVMSDLILKITNQITVGSKWTNTITGYR